MNPDLILVPAGPAHLGLLVQFSPEEYERHMRGVDREAAEVLSADLLSERTRPEVDDRLAGVHQGSGGVPSQGSSPARSESESDPPRVIVCGSRGWTNRELIADTLADLPGNTIVVHGAARGADRIAEQEAQKLGLLIESHPAEWEIDGKRAGLVRNEAMAMLGADLCIAFWDGRSTGTQHMTEMAAKYGIPVRVVHKDFPNREHISADPLGSDTCRCSRPPNNESRPEGRPS